jgi:AhpD family alkylhydroperoxidase
MKASTARDAGRRRIYSFRSLGSDIAWLVRNRRELARIRENGNVSGAFAERIMLAVTAVNECRWCAWYHIDSAEKQGMSPDDIRSMLSGTVPDGVPDEELPALAYATHFAESGGQPDPRLRADLRARYGTATATDIELVIRAIVFGNLTGNTYDACLARLRGHPVPDSNLAFELFYFLASTPFFLRDLVRFRRHRDPWSRQKTSHGTWEART